MNTATIVWVVVVLAVLAGGWYWYSNYSGYSGSMGNGQVCPQDAMQCPDGSYVGRTGPNCEFAACPTK